jgi:ferredoxin
MKYYDQIKQQTEDPAMQIENLIREFFQTSPENSMNFEHIERVFDEPLVGFSNGGDPLFEFLKKDIGSPCMTPVEIFRTSFPDIEARADDLTVISWVLPQTRLTKNDNRKETAFPSERWARAKHYGAAFNKALMIHVANILKKTGIAAVAPVLAPIFTIGVSERYGLASSWSERHAAYVSGLGTFGLCDGLITPRGKAMACGSVIAQIRITPTPRSYTDHHAWCLFYAKGTCGLCVKRCPAGALSKEGHNKNLCSEYEHGVAQEYIRSHFGIDDYACGLCQTGTPCESKNPVRHSGKTGYQDVHNRQDHGSNVGNSS